MESETSPPTKQSPSLHFLLAPILSHAIFPVIFKAWLKTTTGRMLNSSSTKINYSLTRKTKPDRRQPIKLKGKKKTKNLFNLETISCQEISPFLNLKRVSLIRGFVIKWQNIIPWGSCTVYLSSNFKTSLPGISFNPVSLDTKLFLTFLPSKLCDEFQNFSTSFGPLNCKIIKGRKNFIGANALFVLLLFF